MPRNLFVQHGFTPTEETVFRFLIEYSAALPSVIAQQTKIKRPTVYAALENLVGRGLVTKARTGAGTVFRAVPRKTIVQILEQQNRRRFDDAQSRIKLIDAFLSESPQQKKVQMAGYEISTLESGAAVFAQLTEVLHAGDFCSIFNPQEIPEHQLKNVVKKFLDDTAITKPHIREIAVAGPVTNWYCQRIKNNNHIVKTLAKMRAISSDIIIIDNAVVISRYTHDRELAIKIREPHFYQSMQTAFDVLWDNLQTQNN